MSETFEYLTEIPAGFTFGETAGEKLNALIRKILAGNPDMNFSEAFVKVSEQNPDLTQEYMSDIRPE